jgi:hypothetical protein
MDEVGKLAVGAAIIVPFASVINLVLGAMMAIVFYFLFRTVYRKWIESKVVEFGEEVSKEANPVKEQSQTE